MKTIIRMRELRSVFSSNSGIILPAHVARLSVLYEDLRIEMTACAEESIAMLDKIDPRYRRNYFLRRSIATLREFAEALRLLDGCYEFSVIRARFPTDVRRLWEKSIRFFDRNEPLFNKVRNDLGGHFGLQAAQYAIANSGSEVGKIEFVDLSLHQGDMRLIFAGDLAAVASLRHLRNLQN